MSFRKKHFNKWLSMFSKEKISLVLHDIKEAIAGTDKDFTETGLNRSILILSIPMVLEMVMESIFAIADIAFVSKLGSDAIATVGITESLMHIIYSIGMGLSMATTAVISRRIGEKKYKDASEAAFQAILLGLLVSLLIAIPGIVFAEQILKLMGASDSMIREGVAYPRIMFGANVVIMMLFIINSIFRSSGDAAISMRVLVVANLANIILDPCLIFGLGPFPELGLKGAAIATTIGRGIAVVYQIHLLTSGKHRIKVDFKTIEVKFKIIFNLIKVSLGGIGQSIIATSSWIFMVRIIAQFGSDALAGYTIAIRIVIFSLLPSWGMSNAAATLVGQNLGAKKPDRAEKAVWRTGYFNTMVLALFAILFIINPQFFMSLLSDEIKVINYGAQCLRIISYGYLFYAFGMVLVQAFNGAGDTRTPTLINFICFWMVEIPLAYVFANFIGFDERGVYYAIIIAEALIAIIGMILFKRGKWKTEKI